MRQIVLDTETTGLEPKAGHRLIEIGAIELINRRPSGNNFHYYINPERDIDAAAQAVHGLSREFLSDKPLFTDIVDTFIDYVRDAELIIHNAPFDVGFIDYELAHYAHRATSLSKLCTIFDTLPLARRKHPGQKNSLDALCKRYHVDNSDRDLHGALLDARLLAGVYLAMTGGQGRLFDEQMDQANQGSPQTVSDANTTAHYDLPLASLDATDEAAHTAYLDQLQQTSANGCVWLQTTKPESAD